ncbi:MAG: hypothetical protein HC906_04280 [Bacteroidales bacterium]|nr:hypothetical protein [Bacteroidales bacterium]
MKKNLANFCAIVSIFLFILPGCSKNKNQNTSGQEDIKPIPSVCLWDKISLRELPAKSSVPLIQLDLGEMLLFTGKKSIDSSYHLQEYLQVIYKEKSYWIPKMAVVIDAAPAVIIREATIFCAPIY